MKLEDEFMGAPLSLEYQTARAGAGADQTNGDLRLYQRSWLREGVMIGSGILGLSLLAHFRVPLSFSPVPITGQSYGVAVIALMFPVKRSLVTVLAYIFLGFAGLPVLAHAQAAWHWGPTGGYLVGMVLSSYIVARLAHRKAIPMSFFRAVSLAFLSSYIIFACGLIGLSFYVKASQLLILGYLPFVPGDCVKAVTAAATATWGRRRWPES